MTSRSPQDDAPIIETARLAIRQYMPDDIHDLHGLLSDPAVMAFWPAPFDRAQTEAWLQRALLNYRVFGLGRWAVTLRSSGNFIGDCGLIPIRVEGEATHDLGWIVHCAHWNQGYATEAGAACLQLAFGEFGLTQVFSNMPADHAASIRVAEKLGMSRSTLFHNPRNRNLPTCLYRITSAEFIG
jgi:[ribosomal protein S5]-alanine N-acetyltransferase